MEKVKILCLGLKKPNEYDEYTILLDLYNTIKSKTGFAEDKYEYKTYEYYGLEEQDGEEEILEIEASFKNEGKNYKIFLGKSSFSSVNRVVTIVLEYLENDLIDIGVNESFESNLYDFKIKLKNILGKMYNEIHWQLDSQNERLSSYLYSQVHSIENRFREIINEYMIRVYGVDWFKNKINTEYYEKYELFSKWFRDSKYHTFKNVKTELFNLQITDLIKMLKDSYSEDYIYSIDGNINEIKNILKENANKVLNDNVLGLTKIWEKEKFNNVFGENIDGIWQDFSNMRNMIAHNKPICKELFNDICTNVTNLKNLFETAENEINRKIRSNEERLKMKFYREEMDRFYLMDCDIEELPDIDDLLERITEDDEVIELFNYFEDYKSNISAVIEDMNSSLYEIFDYIDFDDIEQAKEKLFVLNDILNFRHGSERDRAEKYINVMDNAEGLLLIKEDFEVLINQRIEYMDSIVNKTNCLEISSFQEGIIANLYDTNGNCLEVEVCGWLCPERGSTDTIYITVKYCGEKEEPVGIIEKSYGDYELADDTYALPTFSDELSISMRNLLKFLYEFRENNIKILKEHRDRIDEIRG